MRRIIFITLFIIVAVIIALSFHQPPMRLMPTPKLVLGAGPNAFAANPVLARTNTIEFFYATNRLPVGPRNNRLYAVVPGRDLNLGVGQVRIGGAQTSWEQIYALSTGAGDDRRPQLNLEAMVELATIDEDGAMTPGLRAWLALVDGALERSRDKDIIIYVHGANATVERAAGQAAQLRHFTRQNSVVLLFAWPTAENFLRYPRDVQTAFGAAPQLAKLVELLAAQTSARKIDVLTYSAGGMVGSDGLALVGRKARAAGGIDPRLGEVYHAAPDADTRGFVDDLRDYAGVANRVTVAANLNDSALRLSQLINRASRAGRPDFSELSPNATRFLLDANRNAGLVLLDVRPAQMSGISERAHTFWYDDPWASSDVLLTLLLQLPPAQRGLAQGTAPSGATYWTFPADYPARLAALMAAQREKAPVAR